MITDKDAKEMAVLTVVVLATILLVGIMRNVGGESSGPRTHEGVIVQMRNDPAWNEWRPPRMEYKCDGVGNPGVPPGNTCRFVSIPGTTVAHPAQYYLVIQLGCEAVMETEVSAEVYRSVQVGDTHEISLTDDPCE